MLIFFIIIICIILVVRHFSKKGEERWKSVATLFLEEFDDILAAIYIEKLNNIDMLHYGRQLPSEMRKTFLSMATAKSFIDYTCTHIVSVAKNGNINDNDKRNVLCIIKKDLILLKKLYDHYLYTHGALSKIYKNNKYDIEVESLDVETFYRIINTLIYKTWK